MIGAQRRPIRGIDGPQVSRGRSGGMFQPLIGMHSSLEIEIPCRRQGDHAHERQVAITHPRAPIEVTVAHNHAILTRGTHRAEVLRPV